MKTNNNFKTWLNETFKIKSASPIAYQSKNPEDKNLYGKTEIVSMYAKLTNA